MNSDSENTIRVMIVDDHFFTRLGLSAALNLEPDLSVIAEASSGQEAIDLYTQHLPDIAILDGNLPDMHGTDVAREIVKRFDAAHLLIFSVEETEEDIHRAVSAGVRGYLPKNAARPDLIQAVRTVAAGRRYFPQGLLGKLNDRRCHPALSTREHQVLLGMSRGWPNKLIAAEMNVSTETIKTFVARILGKLNAEDRIQAVMTALDRGLLKR